MKKLFALCAVLSVFFIPSVSHASMTINSVLLNGVTGNKIQVVPGSNITATVNATLTNGTKWKATAWGMATSSNGFEVTCVNSKNAKAGTKNSPDGAYSETFTIKAPADPGIYTVTFLGDGANNCGQTIPGSTYDVSQAVQVGSNTNPPVIEPHDDVLITSLTATAVTYDNPTASDDIDTSVTVVCSPASGSTFPLGDTTVTCTAQDSSGNQAIPTTFKVTVVQPSGIPFVMETQSDASTLCSPDWRTCFTGGLSFTDINLGLGSGLGNGSLKSVTIAKDASSPFVSEPWVIDIWCYTDSAYSAPCTDWVLPNTWNGFNPSLVTEFANQSSDNTHWTADFTNTLHELNYDGTPGVVFKPNYYYKLRVSDNGWNIGAYGSAAGALYYSITGLTL